MLVGHKSSLGRVPRFPGVSIGSLYNVGVITRTVADSALVLDVIAGPDDRDPVSLPACNLSYLAESAGGIESLRIAYSPDLGYATVDPGIAQVCERAGGRLTEAGSIVEYVELDWNDPYPWWNVLFYSNLTAALQKEAEGKEELLDPGLRNAIAAGRSLRGGDVTEALAGQYEFWQQVRRLYRDYDLLVTPTMAVAPFPVGRDDPDALPDRLAGELHWTQFTYPFNLTGQPAISVPCGRTTADLPVGMQMIGRRFDDATVLRVARAWEGIQPWAERRP
jgi:aspartyl-tRNA(Asn)/glutamyl-tRNA(Gln) amidotransferase subunit A